MSKIQELTDYGQSVWLNYLRRAFIESGELREAIDEGITGFTSTPNIFERSIVGSSDYDKLLEEFFASGMPVKDIYLALIVDDIQRAADVVHPIFEFSEGLNGFITFELNPDIAHDPVGTVAEARHMLAMVNRANVMIEVPATTAGMAAIEQLTSDGVNVNATHIYSLETYQQVAEAYLRGVKEYIVSHSVWRQNPTSVASISLSPVDDEVDQRLSQTDRTDLQMRAGLSLAKVIFQRFSEIFSGSEWEDLASRGARVQRPKWTRLTPHSFRYPDTFYIDSLVGPDTVVTMSPETLVAFRDRGRVASELRHGMEPANKHLEELSDLGIDLSEIGRELQGKSLEAFGHYYRALINSVTLKRNDLENEREHFAFHLGQFEPLVYQALDTFCDENIMRRIWSHDHTVWKPEPIEISNRLGWLHIAEKMQVNSRALRSFTKSIRREGFTDVVVVGMGGSSLAPNVYAKAFSPWIRLLHPETEQLRVKVFDTTNPDAIRSLEKQSNLERSLFIISSKSGNTIETLAGFNYFYKRVLERVGEEKAGRHFVAITDPGTNLADLSKKYAFRETFLNDPTIGGRFSALSYFGLVPAALIGLDLDELLDRSLTMSCNASSCNYPLEGDNIAAQLGTVLGRLAQEGCDKLTIITSPSLDSFAPWIEQLVAESSGKDGTGIVPIVGETLGEPEIYGEDRLFVYHRLEGDSTHDEALQALIDAGHPAIVIDLKDIYDLGGLFFTWEMATAIACYHLNVNPFNQPDVEAANKLARSLIADYLEIDQQPLVDAKLPDVELLAQFLEPTQPGDYISIQAFLAPTTETDALIQDLRMKLWNRYHLATTTAYGPSYLHSTGQLHKGGPNQGHFIQLISHPIKDIPIPMEAGSERAELTFGVLHQAQAVGDRMALTNAHRHIIQIQLGKDVPAGLKLMAKGLLPVADYSVVTA